MRLWHKDLIPILPRQQLLAQWRECCLIAKNIKKFGSPRHVLVNEIMAYPIEDFYSYCILVSLEMTYRKYKNDWTKLAGLWDFDIKRIVPYPILFKDWHNDRYLKQCFYNLQEKYDRGAIPENEWQKIERSYHELS